MNTIGFVRPFYCLVIECGYSKKFVLDGLVLFISNPNGMPNLVERIV